jgi:hypothetical protein
VEGLKKREEPVLWEIPMEETRPNIRVYKDMKIKVILKFAGIKFAGRISRRNG